MFITVFVPTYCRPQDLKCCLDALSQQTRLPEQVIVTIRDIDRETWELIENSTFESFPVVTLKVTEPGSLAAHNAAFRILEGDIVAITDDDAAPRPDWLARIEELYTARPEVGGFGGRDILYRDGELVEGDLQANVGLITWFGRVIGNHHLGCGGLREVDQLKGVNSSFRVELLKNFEYDKCLKYMATHTSWDLNLSLYTKARGWKLIYDSNLLVDHYSGRRVGMAERPSVTTQLNYDAQKLVNGIFNQTYVALSYLPNSKKLTFLAWSILVGNRGRRGLLQAVRFLPSEGFFAIQKFADNLKGRWLGWQQWRRNSKTKINPKIRKPLNHV
ncbi:glycosyltransferase family 2 protein [Halomicronema sp. CCY15110]|uniref:glycosyltransferase family 2 protein n=1 Tax=Halomicronema sp. CCY15110 TaxID=2767773 RepID=UPI001950E594|nr:glycosyltransferase family A protein [Halomicronema sp. CCY15110]